MRADQMRRCKKCGYNLPILIFAKERGPRAAVDISTAAQRSWVCMPCQQEARDARKQANRWRKKAQTARYSHAARLRLTPSLLANTFGWTDERISRDMEHAHVCCYCEKPFADMPNGIQNITVDIHDRDAPPEYKTNTRIICQTCNRHKGTLSPEAFAALQIGYRIRAGAATGLDEPDGSHENGTLALWG